MLSPLQHYNQIPVYQFPLSFPPPRSRYIYLSWALWEQRLGNISNARKLLQRGHDLNRTDPAILQAWGMLEGQEGKVEEARVLFEKAVEIDASHLYVWQVREVRGGVGGGGCMGGVYV